MKYFRVGYLDVHFNISRFCNVFHSPFCSINNLIYMLKQYDLKSE